jgi:hypothetical protein
MPARIQAGVHVYTGSPEINEPSRTHADESLLFTKLIHRFAQFALSQARRNLCAGTKSGVDHRPRRHGGSMRLKGAPISGA